MSGVGSNFPQYSAKPAFNQVSAQLGNWRPDLAQPAAVGQTQKPVLFSPHDLFISRVSQKPGTVPAVSLFQGKPTLPPAPAGQTHATTGSGYYPFNNRMEGGHNDMQGKPLKTLQDFLSGKAPYVSIALDENMYEHVIASRRQKYLKTKDPKLKKYMTMEPQVKYGDTFRIPELEQKYGRKIIFKAVDTGGAFRDKGFKRVDIANKTRKDTYDPTINGKLTLIKD